MRPNLESLEARLNPSSPATAVIVGNDLVITGRTDDAGPVRDLVAVGGTNLNAVTVRIDSGTSDPTHPVTSTHLTFTFALNPDSLIRANLLDGNDTYQQTGSLRAIVHGDAGNDVISGGAGDDVLIGDAGLDNLRGNAGNDLILGGNGSDMLYGNDGDDVLVGGGSSLSDDDLLAVAPAWAASHTADAAFVATITDYTGADILRGDDFGHPAGADWFIADAVDAVQGFSAADGDVVTRI